MMALWSYPIDIQLMDVECCQLSDIQRKLSLQIFHAFCQFVIIIMLAFWGMFGWNFAFRVLLMPSLWIFLFSITTSVFGWSGEGSNAFVKQHIYHLIFLVSGGIWTGYDCLSFIPLLPDGNQLIIHSCSFFRHGASQIQICFLCSGHKCSLLNTNEGCWV